MFWNFPHNFQCLNSLHSSYVLHFRKLDHKKVLECSFLNILWLTFVQNAAKNTIVSNMEACLMWKICWITHTARVGHLRQSLVPLGFETKLTQLSHWLCDQNRILCARYVALKQKKNQNTKIQRAGHTQLQISGI